MRQTGCGVHDTGSNFGSYFDKSKNSYDRMSTCIFYCGVGCFNACFYLNLTCFVECDENRKVGLKVVLA